MTAIIPGGSTWPQPGFFRGFPPEEEGASKPGGATDPAAARVPGRALPGHVLVVDDDPGVLESMEVLLDTLGYRVTCAASGAALRARLDPLPDIILMDLMMPGESGEELTLWLLSREETRNIPVIVLSAHHQAPQIAARLGAAAVLTKPFELDALLALFKRHGLS